jgi:dTDP-4-amino-4,6-dideoxygalactose transaminase
MLEGERMAIARQRIHVPRGGWLRAMSGTITGTLWEGDEVDRLERAFADFIGAPESVAVPSGRAGLSFIFSALGLEPGAEVICSAFGYPVVPHLAKSLGFELRLSAAITDRTRVVIATHLYGVPCQIREIAEIAEAHGATLIEDCAHCFGASVDGRRAGAWGSFGYFSFETSKPINTMGGGMVTIADPEIARRVREVARSEPNKNLSWLSKRLFKTTFEATVTNPLVFNLGVYPALRLLEGKGEEGERFASGYQRDEVTMQGRLGRFTNYQANLGLRQMIPKMTRVARELLKRGVDTKHHYMRDCSGLLDGEVSFPNAERAEREVLHLPAYPELSDGQIDRVAGAVEQSLATLGAEAR